MGPTTPEENLKKKFAADPVHYSKAGFAEFDPKAPVLGKPGSADTRLAWGPQRLITLY